jgi:hypothetical protein
MGWRVQGIIEAFRGIEIVEPGNLLNYESMIEIVGDSHR